MWFASWGAAAMLAFLSAGQRQPSGFVVRLDFRVLAFTAAISILTGILFGIAPAILATRVDLTPALREAAGVSKFGAASRQAGFNLGHGLVVVQVALTMVVLAAAGLLVHTLANLKSINPGFDSRNVLLFDIHSWLAVRPERSEWLFPSQSGTPLHDRNLLRRKVWPVCDRLSIARFGWHTLRHTFSTHGGTSGVPLPVMQSLLGHTSAETTMLYTHPLAGAQREAVEKLASILFPNVPIPHDSQLAKVG